MSPCLPKQGGGKVIHLGVEFMARIYLLRLGWVGRYTFN